MRVASIESSLPAELPVSLPLTLEQRPSKSSTIMKLLLILPAGVALLYPFVLIASHAVADPAGRVALGSPGALIPVLIGLAFWAVLFGWPLQRLATTIARRRTVTISEAGVAVTEETLLGKHDWHEPLSAFDGLAHHVRASLSGVRHELILNHPERDRSVLVALAPRFSQTEIDRVKALLSQAEIPSHALYRFRLPSRVSNAAGATPALAAVGT